MKPNFLKKKQLMLVSPWLLAAAIGLLALIVVAFAANNIQREKDILTDSLFQKGQSLINFVGAGMRASMRSGMLGRVGQEPEAAHTQQLIEQASRAEDIHYIAVVDQSGKIIAHSDYEKVGTVIDRDMQHINDVDARGRHHIVTELTPSRKVFEVLSPFEPFRPHGDYLKGQWQNHFLEMHPVERKMTILVGLDMTAIEKAVGQYRVQVVSLSLVLLLVGLGGWISLLAAQSYNISQNTLNRIQAFTGLLISSLPVGIIATDQEGTIRTMNQAAEEMIGVENTQAVNRLPSQSLPQEVAEFFDLSDEGDEILDRDLSLRGSDAPMKSLHLSSLPVYNREKVYTGRMVLIYDLSEIKQLEKEVQRHERLAALGKMAAGVAHEVRNPLSSIKGFATLLGSKFKTGSDEQEAAHLLVHEAERLNRSITELLNYARPTPLKPEKVNLEEFIGNSLKLISTDANALGVDLLLDVAPETPDVMVDPDRLNQVLLNLYLNGLQSMDSIKKQGHLLVAARANEPHDGMVSIEVEDTGAGIPEDLLEKILDPYFTTKPEGTGLGLAMAHKIIDEHGGSIRFTSTEGEGTTVTITLPINQPV